MVRENIAIQSNGKIVVSGYMHNGTDFDFAVYRDLSKWQSGYHLQWRWEWSILALQPVENDAAYGLAIESDGKNRGCRQYWRCTIWFNNNFGIMRLNKNGSLDLTFDGDGRKSTNFGGDDYANSVALQPDGKIVVGGLHVDPHLLVVITRWCVTTRMAAWIPLSMARVEKYLAYFQCSTIWSFSRTVKS
jgi:uncharacterized delta-60 repeat protein